jgi:hypothetical protein
MADNGRSASLHWKDKIVQAAVVAILTPIYEAEFLGFSVLQRQIERGKHETIIAVVQLRERWR